MQSKGKTSEARPKIETSDLLLFQKSLEDRIQLFEKEKEGESGVMRKVTLLSYSFVFSYLHYKSVWSAVNTEKRDPHSSAGATQCGTA